MDLDGYVSQLRSQLAGAAAAGGEDTREIAERLSTALEPAVRLVLLEVLSDAAGEITREIAPGSVDVRLRGRDPELVVSRPTPPGPAADVPGTTTSAPEPVDETSTSRTTLRLPDHLKARAERAATEAGVSVNSWFVRAIAAALDDGADHGRQRTSGSSAFRGWAR